MNLRSRMLMIAVLASSLASTGCLFRSHRVPSEVSSVPLQSATQKQLVDKLNAISSAIHTVNATVDISTTVGGAKKGKVTEYSEITGYILAEKPSLLRMIGQFPIVKNRAFDMVSNAQGFELWIPTRNRFIIGPNQVTKPSRIPSKTFARRSFWNRSCSAACNPMRSLCWKQEFRRSPSRIPSAEELPSRITSSTWSTGSEFRAVASFAQDLLQPHRSVALSSASLQ